MDIPKKLCIQWCVFLKSDEINDIKKHLEMERKWKTFNLFRHDMKLGQNALVLPELKKTWPLCSNHRIKELECEILVCMCALLRTLHGLFGSITAVHQSFQRDFMHHISHHGFALLLKNIFFVTCPILFFYSLSEYIWVCCTRQMQTVLIRMTI